MSGAKDLAAGNDWPNVAKLTIDNVREALTADLALEHHRSKQTG